MVSFHPFKHCATADTLSDARYDTTSTAGHSATPEDPEVDVHEFTRLVLVTSAEQVFFHSISARVLVA